MNILQVGLGDCIRLQDCSIIYQCIPMCIGVDSKCWLFRFSGSRGIQG